MNTENLYANEAAEAATPSPEFINAVSEFFDIDPSDLLVELGYYMREANDTPVAVLSENALSVK